MGSNWETKNLGDVITLHRGYDLPSHKREKGRIPIISSSGVSGFHNISKVKAPGVITGRYGTLGQVFYQSTDFWPLNTTLYVSDFKGNNPRFIAYLLQTLHLETRSVAAAVPGLDRNALHLLPVTIPSSPEQIKIASILTPYDDLIENNSRRIQILEEMTQTIYREWFVNFHFPGYKNVPLVESEFGLIPDGWTIRKIDEVCSYVGSGGTPARMESDYWQPENIDWFKTKELQDGFLFSSEEKISENGLNNSSAKYFPPNTVVMAIYAAPTVGRLGILTKEATFNQACCGLVNKKGVITHLFLFHKLYELRNHFNNIAQGAAQQNINNQKVKETKIILPPYEKICKFDSVVSPLYGLIKNLTMINRNLIQQRDILLPKLISGEIVVSDIQE